MWCLDRRGKYRDIVKVEVVTVPCITAGRPRLTANAEHLVENTPAFVEWNAVCLELVRSVAGANTEYRSAVGDAIKRGDLLDDVRRMVQRCQVDAGRIRSVWAPTPARKTKGAASSLTSGENEW